jgi:cytidylate kinase
VQDLEKRLQEQKEKEEREEQEFLEAHTTHIDNIDTYHIFAYISTVDSTACFQTISSRKGDAEIFGKLSESKLFHSCFKCVVWQDVF